MKKLALKPESLAVQSFPTETEGGGTLGTVRANDDDTRISDCICPETCPWTGCTDCSCFDVCPSNGGA